MKSESQRDESSLLLADLVLDRKTLASKKILLSAELSLLWSVPEMEKLSLYPVDLVAFQTELGRE